MYNKVIASEDPILINFSKTESFLGGTALGLTFMGANAVFNFLESMPHEISDLMQPFAFLGVAPLFGLIVTLFIALCNDKAYFSLISGLKQLCIHKSTEETFDYLREQYPELKDKILHKLVQQIKE